MLLETILSRFHPVCRLTCCFLRFHFNWIYPRACDRLTRVNSRFILMFSSHLHLFPTNSLIFSGFPTKLSSFPSRMFVTWPAHLTHCAPSYCWPVHQLWHSITPFFINLQNSFFSRQKFDAVSLSDLGDGAPRLAHAWSSENLPLLQTQRNTQDNKRGSSLSSEWSHGWRTCPFSTWRRRRNLVAPWLHWNENGVPLNRGQHRKAGDGCCARHNWMVSSLPSSYGFRWECMWPVVLSLIWWSILNIQILLILLLIRFTCF